MPPSVLVVQRELVCAQGLAAKLDAAYQSATQVVTTPVEAAARLNCPGPDLLLIDWDSPSSDTLDLVRVWTRSRPETAVIVYAVDREESAQRCRDAGCRAVLMRHEGFDALLDRIVAVCPVALDRRSPDDTNGPTPTPRQKQLCEMINRGLSNKEIARELGLALHTVKNHVHLLIAKYGVETRQEAARVVLFPRHRDGGGQTPAGTPRASIDPRDGRSAVGRG